VVLGLKRQVFGLGFKGQVLGLGLGLEGKVLVNITASALNLLGDPSSFPFPLNAIGRPDLSTDLAYSIILTKLVSFLRTVVRLSHILDIHLLLLLLLMMMMMMIACICICSRLLFCYHGFSNNFAIYQRYKADHMYSALHRIQTTLKRSGMDHTV